ncbi:MAG TPA: KGK domain-containing protein [Coleofasciculaceae cyanobacterium]
MEVVKRCFNVNEQMKNSLFGQGLDCEALRFGKKGWQKGKFRIQMSIEFCPDEPDMEEASPSNEFLQPESPLDDLRQMMNQEIQS